MKKQVKCGILVLLLALALLADIAVPAVNAVGTVEIAFGQVHGKSGTQVSVPVTIKNNSGIASFRFRIAYDTQALTYETIEKGAALTGGTLTASYQQGDKELAITWFDVKNITGDGVLFNLVFTIAEGANGTYPLTVDYLPQDVVSASWNRVDTVVTEGWIRTGVNISGTITCACKATDAVTVKLMQGNTEIAKDVTTDGTYQLTSVQQGEYTLVVSQPNHTPCTYPITVAGKDIVQNVSLYLPGDINADGVVNNRDLTRLFQYLSDWEVEVNQPALDVNGDGSVNNRDLTRLFQYLSDWDVKIY